jgi:hypothetical protein
MIEQSIYNFRILVVVGFVLLLVGLPTIYRQQSSIASLKNPRLKRYWQFVLFFTSGVCITFGAIIWMTMLSSSLTVVTNHPADFDLLSMTNVEYLENLRVVDFTIPAFGERSSKSNDISTYNPIDRSIHIKSQLADKTVWFHELGHHIHSYLLTDGERLAFDSIHQHDVAALSSGKMTDFPSAYSATNVREDFAESFMYYVNDPAPSEHLNPSRIELFDMIVQRISPLCAAEQRDSIAGDLGRCVWRTKPVNFNSPPTFSTFSMCPSGTSEIETVCDCAKNTTTPCMARCFYCR